MRYFPLSATLLLLPAFALAQTTAPIAPDSMVIQIGDKAKILFIAQQPDGFDEIAPYDLNAVFAQLWAQKQRSSGPSTQILSAKAAKKLRQADYVKPQGKMPFFEKRIYLNGFVGMNTIVSPTVYTTSGYTSINKGGSNDFILTGVNLSRDSTPSYLTNAYNTYTDSRITLGIGGAIYLRLKDNPRYNLSIRSGLNIDYFQYVRTVTRALEGTQTIYKGTNDTIGVKVNRIIFVPTGILKSYVLYPNITIAPVLFLKNKAGQKSWYIGAGVRTGPLIQFREYKPNSTSFPRSSEILHIDTQIGFTGQIGWKYLGLVFHHQPAWNGGPGYRSLGLRLGY